MKEKQVVAGLLFVCCVGLVAVLAMKGFNKAEKAIGRQKTSTSFIADYTKIITEAEKNLDEQEKLFVNETGTRAQNKDTTIAFAANRTLIKFWDSLRRFDISGYYYSNMYEIAPTEFNLMNASQRFYTYATVANDSAEATYYLLKAEQGYDKVIKMDSTNLDAKVGKALCILPDRNRLMSEVIPMLKSVVRADSNNVQANYTLGLLQIESGQLQKALASFTKLVSLQPSNGEFYFYLAEVQKRMGNKADALENLEKAKNFLPPAQRQKIDNSINELKSN